MQIFQKSVIQKHLNGLDKQEVEKSFQVFRANYSPDKIEKIKSLKEEEYQDGFLRDIFVDVFGYTLKPNDNYNLVRELKNLADSKKSDGAIVKWQQGLETPNVVAVIELKSTSTKDLTSVTQQAFNYKNNQPGCKYVITSNFQKLRFYIDYSNEYEEFDLFELAQTTPNVGLPLRFSELYLLLNKDSIFSNIPLTIKKETRFHEQNISEQLYRDYSDFKYKIFENLIKNNPEFDKLTLFEKSQKLLDRILFIFFAEDSGLLPANSISRIIEHHQQLVDLDAEKPLYDIYKQYFGYMNIGRKGKVTADDIPAYNGGLFAPDEVLDKVIIDNEILRNDSIKLSKYDYSTEVDVNILGNIFEHSLNEIEEIEKQLLLNKGLQTLVQTTDSKKDLGNSGLQLLLNKGLQPLVHTTKRKKDGVYYTPKYITQYIVENTLGKLCQNKRKELDIFEIEFDDIYFNKGSQTLVSKKLTDKGKILFDKLNTYKEWLKTLKILDPACGSGAFLNQALNFLIAEHKQIDDLIAELIENTNDGLTPRLRLWDTDKSILENNLFGVDINEESVEIAKLSLWLRTARRERKLSNLNDNIKCGNSLIDDPAVAGDKAFNWQKEFPQVFKEKELKAWHVTWVTYNSRISERMKTYQKVIIQKRLNKGLQPLVQSWIFDEEMEIEVTKHIKDVVIENKYIVPAYNICDDHIHLLLICEQEEISNIVRKLKGKSSQKIKEYLNIDKDAEFHLWAQKFNTSFIENEEQLHNTIHYIDNNRIKHDLPLNKGLQPLVQEMITPIEDAFKPQYSGGFDVIIGNPPYIKEYTNRLAFDGLHSHYCYQGKMDLWYFFGALALQLVKKDTGFIGYIAPNNWITNSGASKFRNIILNKGKILEFIDFGDFKVFDSAGIQTMIFIMQRTDENSIYNFQYSKIIDSKIDHETNQLFLQKVNDSRFTYFTTKIEKEYYLDKPINFINADTSIIIDKIAKKQNFVLTDKEVAQGIVAAPDKAFIVNEKDINKFSFNEKFFIKRFFTGCERYITKNSNKYILYLSKKNFSEDIENYPNIKNHFAPFKQELEDAKIRFKTPEKKYYYLHRERDEVFFSKGEKIISASRCFSPSFTYTEEEFYGSRALNFIKTDRISIKYLVGLFNSKLSHFWLLHKGKLTGEMLQIDKNQLVSIPIFEPSQEIQNVIAELVTLIIDNKQKEIDYSELLKQAKAEDNFDREIKLSKELENIKTEIQRAENKINSKIYELYELSERDIAAIEQI